ncbi:hypothetical protein ACFL3T_01900 [Patescibacteria group bacterium]
MSENPYTQSFEINPDKIQVVVYRDYDTQKLYFDTVLPGENFVHTDSDGLELVDVIEVDYYMNSGEERIIPLLKELDKHLKGEIPVSSIMSDIARAVWERAKISEVE